MNLSNQEERAKEEVAKAEKELAEFLSSGQADKTKRRLLFRNKELAHRRLNNAINDGIFLSQIGCVIGRDGETYASKSHAAKFNA